MKTIYIKATGKCNLNCSHCFTNGRNGDGEIWSVENVARWIKDFIAQYPNDDHHLELHGGEIFLRPLNELSRFTTIFESYDNVTIGATSNLVFKLTDEHIAFIKNSLGNSIATSWDSGIRFENEKQKNLWENNVKLLKDAGVFVKVFLSVTKSLVEKDPLEIIDYFNKIGPDELALERLTLSGNAIKNGQIFPTNESQDNWYLSLYKEYKKRETNFNIVTLDILERRLKENKVKEDTHCRNCEQNLVTINSDGSLSGCPNTAEVFKYTTLENGVGDFIYSQGRISRIAKELDIPKHCLRCDVFQHCGGDCHQLPWDGERCGGLKNTIRYLLGKGSSDPITLINL